MEHSFANLSKYTAYKEIASNYDEAKALLESKKLAYGEGGVVSFYFPGRSAEVKTIEQMLGIGGIDGSIMVYSNILGADSRVDDATIFLASKNKTVKLSEAFDMVIENINDITLADALGEVKASIDAQSTKNAEKLDLLNTTLEKMIEAIEKSHAITVAQAVN